MISTDCFNLKRFRTEYSVTQGLAGHSLFLQDPPSWIPFHRKIGETCDGNGTLYGPELKSKDNWLGKMMETDCQDTGCSGKQWKTRKSDERKVENRMLFRFPWASKMNYRNSSTMPPEVSKDYEDFQWLQHKREVVFAVGCFSLLLLIVVIIHFAMEGFRFTFVMPWILTASLSFLLFARLFLCYEASQITCRHISSILFLLVSISWFIDNSFCKNPAHKKDGQYYVKTGSAVYRYDFGFEPSLSVISCIIFTVKKLFVLDHGLAIILLCYLSSLVLCDPRFFHSTSFV